MRKVCHKYQLLAGKRLFPGFRLQNPCTNFRVEKELFLAGFMEASGGRKTSPGRARGVAERHAFGNWLTGLSDQEPAACWAACWGLDFRCGRSRGGLKPGHHGDETS